MIQKDLFPETLIGQTQSLVQDIPVSRSALRANKKGPRIHATSGPTYIKSLHSKDPLGVFLKMFLVTLPWDSTKFSLTWKMKNTPARRSIYQLTRLVLPTKENASGSSASLWATPTTQEFEHPNMNLNNQGRRVSKDGKNSHSLNLADSVKMWPTPTTNGYGQEGQYNNLYNKMITGIITQEDFEAMTSYKIQQMWPTPTTKGYGHGSEGQYQNLYKKMVDGIISQEDLEVMTKTKMENHRSYKKMTEMWPTPRARDFKDGYVVPPSVKKGSRTHTLGTKVVEEAMWPTPTANEDAAGRPNGKMQRMLGNDPNIRGKTLKEWEKGSLNPDWVEWLMGYDRGWTDLDCDNTQPHDGFIKEPEDIPRVAKGKKNRAKRLKGLGNAVLPQIPMQIALAIKKTREVELCKNVKKKDVKTKQT